MFPALREVCREEGKIIKSKVLLDVSVTLRGVPPFPFGYKQKRRENQICFANASVVGAVVSVPCVRMGIKKDNPATPFEIYK